MSETVDDEVISEELHRKAENLEQIADWILKDGKILSYNEFDDFREELGREDYQDLNSFEKFELLTELYNEEREIDRRTDRYKIKELINKVDDLVKAPESYVTDEKDKSKSWRPPLEVITEDKFEEKYRDREELISEKVDDYNTGSHPDEPDLELVNREFYFEDSDEPVIKYIGLEEKWWKPVW